MTIPEREIHTFDKEIARGIRRSAFLALVIQELQTIMCTRCVANGCRRRIDPVAAMAGYSLCQKCWRARGEVRQ